MTTSGADVLARLLGSVDTSTFLSRHWEQRHLLVRDADSTAFGDVFSLEAMDRLLTSSPLSRDRCRVVRNSTNLFPGQANGTGEPTLEQVYGEFRRGASVVLLGLEGQSESVRALGRSLASALSARVQVNAYLTPPTSQALEAHYDTHDVFVLQIHGTKRWWVGPQAVAKPLPEPLWNPTTVADAGAAEGEEFDLRPGDVLYVPRGTLHKAFARESASLHLTIGIHAMTWANALRAALDDVIQRDDRFRSSLPIGFARDADIEDVVVREFGENFRAVLGELDADRMVKGMAESVRAYSMPDLAGHLLDLEDVPRVDQDTTVRRRPSLDWRLDEHGDEVALHFHQKKVTVPARVRHSLTFVTRVEGDFTPADLSDVLDLDGAVRLTRTLLEEGFLTRARSVPSAG